MFSSCGKKVSGTRARGGFRGHTESEEKGKSRRITYSTLLSWIAYRAAHRVRDRNVFARVPIIDSHYPDVVAVQLREPPGPGHHMRTPQVYSDSCTLSRV